MERERMYSEGEGVRTNKGHSVAGLQKAYHAKTNSYQGYSGRVRIVEGNPYFDEYCKFNSDGSAFKHEYGDINLTEVK